MQATLSLARNNATQRRGRMTTATLWLFLIAPAFLSKPCHAGNIIYDNSTSDAIQYTRELALSDVKTNSSRQVKDRVAKWDRLFEQVVSDYCEQRYGAASEKVNLCHSEAGEPGMPQKCMLATYILSGVIQFELAEIDNSEATFKKAADLLDQDDAKQKDVRASILNWIGRAELEQGKFSSALAHFNAVTMVRQSEHGDTELKFDPVLVDKTQALTWLGKLKEAKSLCKKIEDSIQDKRTNDLPEFARFKLTCSRIEYETGNYDAALGILQKATQDINSTWPPRLSIELLISLSIVETALGDYTAAEKSCRKALDLSQQHFSVGHTSYSRSRRQLARIYLAIDETKSALEHAKLAGFHLKDGRVRPDQYTADQYALMGEISRRCAELADSKEAKESYQHSSILGLTHSAAIYEQCNARLQFDWAMCDSAAVASAAGMQKPAQEAYDKVLHELFDTVKRPHPEVMHVMSDLGVFLLRVEQYEAAQNLLQSLDDTYAKFSAPSDLQKRAHAIVLVNLGRCQIAVGQMEKSERSTTKGIALLQSMTQPTQRELAIAFTSLAESQTQQGKVRDAQKAIDCSNELIKVTRGGRNRLTANNLRLEAEICLCEKDVTGAKRRCDDAIAIVDDKCGTDDIDLAPILNTRIKVARVQADPIAIEQYEARRARLYTSSGSR